MSSMDSEPLSRNQKVQVVSDVIRERRTWKVLADPDNPIRFDSSRKSTCDQLVMTSIETASWAPFHYDRNESGMAEPWRVDVLTTETCRCIATQFSTWFADIKASNKLPAMLSACGSLVLVSWLPQFDETSGDQTTPVENQRQVDEEHLAATAAYVQNLLLILTAAGMGTYWSSGGQFRTNRMKQKLGIQHSGKLLAAVFVDYSENPASDSLERLPGKHRDRRDQDQSWCNTIEIA